MIYRETKSKGGPSRSKGDRRGLLMLHHRWHGYPTGKLLDVNACGDVLRPANVEQFALASIRGVE